MSFRLPRRRRLGDMHNEQGRCLELGLQRYQVVFVERQRKYVYFMLARDVFAIRGQLR
jgi:hypothetical protein